MHSDGMAQSSAKRRQPVPTSINEAADDADGAFSPRYAAWPARRRSRRASQAPGILEMLHAEPIQTAANDGDHIESAPDPAVAESGDPRLRDPLDGAPLLLDDGRQRVTEPFTAARLYFHERHDFSASGHKVDLMPARPEVPIHDRPPQSLEMGGRHLFPPMAKRLSVHIRLAIGW
jgi:hypothetical protein